eukprot:TRINITY_DN2819_c0_g1_i2.p1 TRINITY_DN2819_c0_g1~~TRINITY_DN2819_c0_g1_i2.p1  ORF type:complete len:930 (+),score=193.72 TRINITY_DN2819_c0_g1_i2:217-3006(+)
MGSCLAPADDATSRTLLNLRRIYGCDVMSRHGRGGPRIDINDLEQFFINCIMRVDSRAGFDPVTAKHDFTALSAVTGLEVDELEEAAEMYVILIRDYGFTGPNLMVQMMRWAGIEPHLIRFLCSTLAPDELLSFAIIIHPIAIFHRGTTAERLAFIFSLCDNDGSGQLSPDEVEKVLKNASGEFIPDERLQVMVEQLFSRIDKNNDGQIQFDEFIEHYPFICKLLGLDQEAEKKQPVEDPDIKLRGVLAAWRMKQVAAALAGKADAKPKTEDDHARNVFAAFQRKKLMRSAPQLTVETPVAAAPAEAAPSQSSPGSSDQSRSLSPTQCPRPGLVLSGSSNSFPARTLTAETNQSPGGTRPTLRTSPSTLAVGAPGGEPRPALRRLRSSRVRNDSDAGSPGGSPQPSPRADAQKRLGEPTMLASWRKSLAPQALSSPEQTGLKAKSSGFFGSIRNFFTSPTVQPQRPETPRTEEIGSAPPTPSNQRGRRFSEDDFIETAIEIQADLRRLRQNALVYHELHGLGGAAVLLATTVHQSSKIRARLEDGATGDDADLFQVAVPQAQSVQSETDSHRPSIASRVSSFATTRMGSKIGFDRGSRYSTQSSFLGGRPNLRLSIAGGSPVGRSSVRGSVISSAPRSPRHAGHRESRFLTGRTMTRSTWTSGSSGEDHSPWSFPHGVQDDHSLGSGGLESPPGEEPATPEQGVSSEAVFHQDLVSPTHTANSPPSRPRLTRSSTTNDAHVLARPSACSYASAGRSRPVRRSQQQQHHEESVNGLSVSPPQGPERSPPSSRPTSPLQQRHSVSSGAGRRRRPSVRLSVHGAVITPGVAPGSSPGSPQSPPPPLLPPPSAGGSPGVATDPVRREVDGEHPFAPSLQLPAAAAAGRLSPHARPALRPVASAPQLAAPPPQYAAVAAPAPAPKPQLLQQQRC